MAVDCSEVARRPWKVVEKVSRDAAVFVDDSAAELLHWAGGIRQLSGCIGVYDLHRDLSTVARDFIAAAPYCHVVIVVSTYLHGPTSEKIAKILSDLQPLECHVFCSQPEEMHAQLIPVSAEDEEDSYSHFGEFQALMRKWINREAGVRVSVQHLPLFHAEVCPGFLTTPTYSTLFPLLPSDVMEIQAHLLHEGNIENSLDSLNQVDFSMLSRQLQTDIKGFASGLNYFMKEWDMSVDVFSMGHTSHFIANQLVTLQASRLRKKTAAHKCSLLLVDRSLDLTGPTLHPPESLADKIISLLPHSTPLANDVCVDMSPLSVARQHGSEKGEEKEGWALYGSLAQPNHPKAKHLLKMFISSKQKECLMELSRCLLDCLSQEGLSVKLSGKLARPSALQLMTFIQQFKDHPQAGVSQHAVLQLACAAVQALEGDTSKHWDKLASTEKVLLLSLYDEESPSIASILAKEARREALSADSANEGKGSATPLSLAELLGVAVGVFSLVGEEKCVRSVKEEKELQEALTSLALKWRPCDMLFLYTLGIGRSDSHAQVAGRFGTVMQRLEGLGTARNHLTTHFRHTFHLEDPSLLPYRPLLPQLMEAVFAPGYPELPDLEYHSHTSVTNILKTSISLFVSSARPRPHQHPTLLLFVVGGVTCSEVRQIREAVNSSKTSVEASPK